LADRPELSSAEIAYHMAIMREMREIIDRRECKQRTLYIFDKDGTLIEPKSGQTFVQSPEDQQLKPGVAEKLAELREQGGVFAMASNQGGCARKTVPVVELHAGMLLYRSGLWRKVVAVNHLNDGTLSVELSDGDEYSYSDYDTVEVSYKTIDDAVEEMRVALKLTGIHFSMMAHSYEADRAEAYAIDGAYCRLIECPEDCPKFRKPHPGMLLYLAEHLEERLVEEFDRKVFVGDLPEDEQAAKAAGFEFEWAETFFA
jgi:histidinol phosphatase-like enzyme